jgi:hypothetical protein
MNEELINQKAKFLNISITNTENINFIGIKIKKSLLLSHFVIIKIKKCLF